MDQSGIVEFAVTGAPEKITDFRTAPFCSRMVFAQMLGLDEISEDVVRGWVHLSRSFFYRKHGSACVDTLRRCTGLATGLCLPGEGREGEDA